MQPWNAAASPSEIFGAYFMENGEAPLPPTRLVPQDLTTFPEVNAPIFASWDGANGHSYNSGPGPAVGGPGYDFNTFPPAYSHGYSGWAGSVASPTATSPFVSAERLGMHVMSAPSSRPTSLTGEGYPHQGCASGSTIPDRHNLQQAYQVK